MDNRRLRNRYSIASEHNHVDIDLTTGVVRGYSEQIRFLLTPTQSHERSGHKGVGVGQGQRCSRRSIIRVDFDSSRYKVARVVLKYGDSPRRWTFDASDSPMADGYGSVVSTSVPASSNQGASTEIHVMNRQLRVYGRWPAPSHNLYARSSSKRSHLCNFQV
ncbi:hypothetical protein J437_LFUL005125 [Ladona fulva]|uniref:Uncharacterized protein n=1 Tax=Ladona fulva TaxID=123851 RepID=A0A8K0KFH9_LADFU|nr:hypothetical protein J437_LFUL005125 [Ladona fulva]